MISNSLSRLLPNPGKHSPTVSAVVPASEAAASKARDGQLQQELEQQQQKNRQKTAHAHGLVSTSPVPTYEETDDSSNSYGSAGSASPKMQPTPSGAAAPHDRPDVPYVGEYGPSRYWRISESKRKAAAAGKEEEDAAVVEEEDDDVPVGSFRTDSTAAPPSPLSDGEEGGEVIRDDASAASAASSTAASEKDDDDDAFLRLQTRRFESMRNLGGLASPPPQPHLPPPADAASAAVEMAKTPAAAAEQWKGSADAAAGGTGTPETAPLSPYSLGNTPGTFQSEANALTSPSKDVSDTDGTPSGMPKSVPDIIGQSPSAEEVTWRDEAKNTHVSPHEYHRTRGNISFRTPHFARRIVTYSRISGSTTGTAEAGGSNDDKSCQVSSATPGIETVASDDPTLYRPSSLSSPSSASAVQATGSTRSLGRERKRTNSLRKLSSFFGRGGKGKKKTKDSAATSTSVAESESAAEPREDQKPEQLQQELEGASTGNDDEEDDSSVNSQQIVLRAPYAPHESRPDLDQIRDPEGVGTASKLTPFSLWYDDAAVVNLDSADADLNDAADDEDRTETSLLDSSVDLSDDQGSDDDDDDDDANNVGIARPSYGVPSRSSPKRRSDKKKEKKKKPSLSSSDGFAFFFQRRGRPAGSSAAAAYYDTESEEEEEESDEEAWSESEDEKSTKSKGAPSDQSIRMGISKPTRCPWDDEEDAFCGGSSSDDDGSSSRSSGNGSSVLAMGPPASTTEILNDLELGPLHGYMLGRAPDSLSGEGGDVKPVERTVHKQTFEGSDVISPRSARLSSSGLHTTKYCTKSLMKKGVDVAGVQGLKAFPLAGTRDKTDTKARHTPSPPNVPSPPSREELAMSLAGTGASSLEVLQEMPPEDSAEPSCSDADVTAKRGRASVGAAPPSVLMSLAYSSIFQSDGDSAASEETPGGALVEYGAKSASCSARSLLAESSCRDLVIPAPSGARRSAMAQAAPSSRSLTIPSANALTVVSQDVPAVAPTSKIYVLLIQPQMKIFELIQILYYPSAATVGDILDLIPANATEQILGKQAYVGLCRPKDSGRASVLTDLDVLASGTAEGGTANIYRGEILVAIPEGYTGDKCKRMANPILANKRFSKLLSKADPLAPKNQRRRSGRRKRPSYRRSSSSCSSLDSSLNGLSETDEL